MSENLGNGWTQYQQLVLSELTRHSDTLTNLQKDVTELKIISSTLNNTFKEVKQDIEDNKDDKVAQKIDIEKLKWKMGAISIVCSAVISFLGQFLLRFLTHTS